MPKICQSENCNNRVFGKGFCKAHQYLRPDFKHSQLKLTPVKKQSDKLKKALQQYRKVRNEFLKAKPICEAGLPGCSKRADQVHHQKGRVGELLTNTAYFLAVCGSCHRIIETQPQMAKERGFSVSRLINY